MSQANVDLVRAIYARFREGDTEHALELVDPDVEVHDRPEVPDPQVYRGHEGLLRARRAGQAAFAGLDVLPEEFVNAGQHVVVALRLQGRVEGAVCRSTSGSTTSGASEMPRPSA